MRCTVESEEMECEVHFGRLGPQARRPIRLASADEYVPAEGKQLTAMSTVNWVGLVLWVVGLLLAVWLLGRLHEEVKPTKLRFFRGGCSARASVVTFYRRLFRRPGKTTIVEPFTIRATTSRGAPTNPTTGRGPLPAGSAEEQIKWLDDLAHDIETKQQ